MSFVWFFLVGKPFRLKSLQEQEIMPSNKLFEKYAQSNGSSISKLGHENTRVATFLSIYQTITGFSLALITSSPLTFSSPRAQDITAQKGSRGERPKPQNPQHCVSRGLGRRPWPWQPTTGRKWAWAFQGVAARRLAARIARQFANSGRGYAARMPVKLSDTLVLTRFCAHPPATRLSRNVTR